MKEACSVKLQTENLCFYSRPKLNKSQAVQISNIMQSSSTLIRIAGPVTEVKKSAVINDWKNISYWEEPEQSKALENKFCLFQIQLGVLGGYNQKKNL